jgi:hypothetical protein
MSEQDNSEFFDPVDEINKIIDNERLALPSIYQKVEKLDVVGEGKALVASANAKTLPARRVGRFEMLEVLERSLARTVLNLTNPGERVFTALRELSDFVNMATTGAQPKIANAHRDLLPVGHPLSTREHNFSTEELAQFHAEWMSADPRIAEAFRPLVASAYRAPEASLEREYVIAKLEATNANEVPRDVILSLTAGIDPYGGGNSFLARSMRARAQRRDRRGRFAWMGGGARVWLGKALKGISTLFRFAGYDSRTDSFDLEIFNHPTLGSGIYSIPADKVEAIKAILPDSVNLGAPKPTLVDKKLLVDPATLVRKDAPTGWTKISSVGGVDTFRSDDGWIATRYPNLASAPNEPSVTRIRGANDDKSLNPDLPVYHIAKGSNDGTVVDKPFAATQSWGDTQALTARYDKKMAPKEEKTKATLEEQPQEFIQGWTKGEGGYIPGKWNSYTEASDTAGGKDFYTDPSGRYVAVKLATKPATWQTGAEDYKQREDERTRKQVLKSGLPIHTFDGAKDWDGNVDNLYRLERVKSDGKRELLGFYQDPEDIERDTEISPAEDKSQEFYESVIADTLQNGGNTIDFVDGNWPEDGYIIAHEPDVVRPDGTLGKREEIYTPEQIADPVEGPKILREFALRNQDKLSQQGFYLGTWLDTVDVKDENGNVVDQREMVFLDVSEYEANFDKAFDMAETRKEIAYYGVSEGKSFYVADEKHRREVVRKTPVFDEAEEKRVRAEADKIIKEEDKWFSDNYLEVQKTRVAFWKGGGDDAIPNPELQKDYPEIYRRLTRRFEAEKSRGFVFRDYIRSVFQMSDGMDPGGRNDGLSGELLRTRDNYVGNDKKTLEMNKALRDGGDVTSKVQKIDALVNKSKLKDDTQFFRGAWLDPELVKDMEVGDMFFDRAFQSMGLEEDTASSYLDFREEASPNKSRVIFRLLLPKGMNAIHVGDDEVIGRRNTKMRIIRKSELDGTTYFDVDVEPQTKEEINARIQGRVPKPEESQVGQSSSELPGNDGGGADGLGIPSTPAVNYGPKPTGQGQASRVTDPDIAIWDNLPEDLGVSKDDLVAESIKMMDSLERTTRQMLKDRVSRSLTKKLDDVSDQEFINLTLSGLSNFMTKEDFGFDGTRSIDFIGVIDMRDTEDGGKFGRYTTIEKLVTNGPVPRNFPKDLIDRLNTGKITRKDAEEVVRLINEIRSNPPILDEFRLHIPSVDDKEFMGYLRYKTISNLVSSWASSSNGTNPLSLAIQSLAAKEFGIPDAAEWDMPIGVANEVRDVAKKNENIIRKFLRAQYDLTQEYFQKKGISKITLYRGIKDFARHDVKDADSSSEENGFVASIKLRPLSSWSTDMGIAHRFRGINGKVFRRQFDVKDIFAFPGTGVGCFPEKEIVILGGTKKDIDVSANFKFGGPVAVFPSTGPLVPIKYEDSLPTPDLMLNNAPRDFRQLTPDERAEISKHNPVGAIWVPIAEDATYYGKELPSELANVLEHDKEAMRTGQMPGNQPGQEVTIGLARALKSGVAKNIAEKLEDVDINEFIKLAVDKGTFSDEFDWSEPKDIDKVILFSSRGGDVNPYSFTLDKIISQSGPDIKDLVERIKARGGKVTFDEAKDLLEMINLRQRQIDPLKEYHIADINDAEIADHLRYQISSDLIKNWAITSNGNDFVSLAMQDVAKKEFGISAAANWQIDPENQKKIDKIVKNNGNLLGRFLRAQYDATQEYFNRKGITKVTLYRGVKKFANHEIVESTFPNGGKFTATLGLRPLSAWSTSRRVAENFASAFEHSRLFRKEFDVKDILCFPGTGFGCLDEREMVVIGGNTKNIDVSGQRNLRSIPGLTEAFEFGKKPENYQIVFKDDKKNPLEDITEAGFRIGDWVNNAPIDLSRIPPDDGGDKFMSEDGIATGLDLWDGVDLESNEHKAEVQDLLVNSNEMKKISNEDYIQVGYELMLLDQEDFGWEGVRDVTDIGFIGLDEGELSGHMAVTEVLDAIWDSEDIRDGDENAKKYPAIWKFLDYYKYPLQEPAKEKVTREDFRKFVEELNDYYELDSENAFLFPDASNEEFMKHYRGGVVSQLVSTWAQTSNDSHPISLAIQDTAINVLGIKDAAPWGKPPEGSDDDYNWVPEEEIIKFKNEIMTKHKAILEAFIKSQYRSTQKWLADRGIKKVVLYRGVKTSNEKEGGLVKLRPLSSWTTNEDTAIEFTRDNNGAGREGAMVFRTTVDAKDIFSTPFTGVGCLDEEELVVLGGIRKVDSRNSGGLRLDGQWPVSNAPKPISNTERKRLEREKRKAEEAVAPSPEEAKQQMEQGQQGIAEVAQTIPETLDTFFDPNNPLNILNARNITNDITGSTTNRDNLSKDDLLQQKLLFMEPTKEWYDLLDKVEQSGMPFAKEIISRIRKKHAKLIEKIENKTLAERQAQIEHDNAIKELHNVVNTLVANALARPNDVPGLNQMTPRLMGTLDDYFGGNPNNNTLTRDRVLQTMAIMNLYTTNDFSIAQADHRFNGLDVLKVISDLATQFGNAYAKHGTSSSNPDRNALTKAVQKIYIENFFGGINPADVSNTTRVLAKLSHDRSLASILPSDAINILQNKADAYSQKAKRLLSRKQDVVSDKENLAKEISKTTKEVLSENGIEFDHGVTLSANDVTWSGVHNFEFATNANNELEFRPTQMPDYEKYNLAQELRDSRGALDILNKAIQSYPKPVALALKQFLIDNKSNFSFFTTSRGVTAVLNPKELEKVHDIGDMSGVIQKLGISGSDKDGAVETTVHELLHLIVNGIFRNQMNAIAWAKQSKETNNVAPDGKISHNFVDGNYGNVAYPMSGNYLDAEDIMMMIRANELGAASPNFANPYIGKYGVASGAQAAVGQNPFSHGELLSTLFESLLGGGLTGMFATTTNPKKVLSGTNPDGTPKYVTMDDSVFSESMLPFGVSMIVLLNELAKLKLGIA